MPETSKTVQEQHTNRQPVQMDYSSYQLYNPKMDNQKKESESEYNVQAYNG